MKNTHQFILFLVCIIFVQCTIEPLPTPLVLKHNINDPFVTTMTPSQIFEIDPNKENVIEGKEGTIIVFPKGCLLNAKGRIIKENVQIELAESLSMEEMLLSNLTTTSNGKILETDGMLYLNATSRNQQLRINPKKPVYIEIPSQDKKPDMMVYKGSRDDNGNMNWTEPQKLEDFIIPVDIYSLDFLPNGFEEEVVKGMPYKNHELVTKELVDSLYYSLSPYFEEEMNDSLITEKNQRGHGEHDHSNDIFYALGISPAIIKAIKDDKFQNTLLATREFEARLQAIFATCNNEVIEIYINNLDKELWELDSMAAQASDMTTLFNFYQEKKTRIKGGNIYTETLQSYYQQRLETIHSELAESYEKQQTEQKAKDRIAKTTTEEYQQLLEKRNDYRKQTYGFTRTDLGWINIDRGTASKDWQAEELEILVDGGGDFNRVYSYLIYTSIKSLYQLNTTDNTTFRTGDENSNTANMPKNKMAVAISIAYKNETPYLAMKEFRIGIEKQLKLHPKARTINEIKEALKVYDNYNEENKIDKDLDFMEFLAKEEKRKGELEEEHLFVMKLFQKAHPCFPNDAENM